MYYFLMRQIRRKIKQLFLIHELLQCTYFYGLCDIENIAIGWEWLEPLRIRYHWCNRGTMYLA